MDNRSDAINKITKIKPTRKSNRNDCQVEKKYNILMEPT